LLNYQLFVTPL